MLQQIAWIDGFSDSLLHEQSHNSWQDAISATITRNARAIAFASYRIFRRLRRRIIRLEERQARFPVSTPSMKSWPTGARGAMSIRCLIWIVESTAFSARYEFHLRIPRRCICRSRRSGFDPLVGQNHSAVRFDESHQRHGQRSHPPSAAAGSPAAGAAEITRPARHGSCTGCSG